MDKIIGGQVMVIGDIHFSDVFTGKHLAYLEECTEILGRLRDIAVEKQPRAIVLLGDLVGWSETNISNRMIFSAFCKWLKDLNEICPVYCIQGNHDMKGYPDFLFFSQFDLIRTSSSCDGYFDYYGYEGQEYPEIRFHLVDYNDENKHLDLIGNDVSNVVLAHNNFTINGITTWYSEHDGIELGMHQNFNGVDMVISGHIHNPSPEIFSAQMPSGESCMLFYPGCPTRPIKDKNMYDSCWIVFIGYNNDSKSTDILPEEFILKPASEIFVPDDEILNERDVDDNDEVMRQEALKDILDELLKYRVMQTDIITQIENIPNASDAAKKMACDYLRIAMGGSV